MMHANQLPRSGASDGPLAARGRTDAATVFALFAGHWQIERIISQQGRFTGTARFAACGSRAYEYQESGVLLLPNGAALAARRAYRYELAEPFIDIVFADGPSAGQRFVRLAWLAEASAWRAMTVHHCADDRYDLALRVDDGDSFSVDIVVRGPRKTYETATRFVRHESAHADSDRSLGARA